MKQSKISLPDVMSESKYYGCETANITDLSTSEEWKNDVVTIYSDPGAIYDHFDLDKVVIFDQNAA